MRKRIAIAATAIVVIVGGLAFALAHHSSPATTAVAANLSTTTVSQTTITNIDQVSGNLDYSGSYDLTGGSGGILTALPPSGTMLQRGDVAAEIDGSNEYLFYGSRPQWRTLQSGISDGPDVEQLDENLIALGYGQGMSPSNTFTSLDTSAIEAWQSATGQTVTGSVALGTLLYMPGPIRVGTHHLEPGAQAQPGAQLATATDTTRVVTVALDTGKESEVKVGDTVSVVLPSGDSTPGTVTDIAKTATPPSSSGSGNSNPTVKLTVAIPNQSALGSLEAAPVTVNITTASANNVLAVPINALVVNPDGTSYGVDVINGSSTRRIKVITGLFSDTMVQVTGNLHEGDTVVVAST